jgi:hypothetical protein
MFIGSIKGNLNAFEESGILQVNTATSVIDLVVRKTLTSDQIREGNWVQASVIAKDATELVYIDSKEVDASLRSTIRFISRVNIEGRSELSLLADELNLPEENLEKILSKELPFPEELLEADLSDFSSIPIFSALIQLQKETAVSLIVSDIYFYRLLPKYLKCDMDVLFALLDNGIENLITVDPEVLENKELVKKIVAKNGLAIGYLDSYRADSELVYIAACQNIEALFQADEALKDDPELILKLLPVSSKAFEFASLYLQYNREFLVEAYPYIAISLPKYATQRTAEEVRNIAFSTEIAPLKDKILNYRNTEIKDYLASIYFDFKRSKGIEKLTELTETRQFASLAILGFLGLNDGKDATSYFRKHSKKLLKFLTENREKLKNKRNSSFHSLLQLLKNLNHPEISIEQRVQILNGCLTGTFEETQKKMCYVSSLITSDFAFFRTLKRFTIPEFTTALFNLLKKHEFIGDEYEEPFKRVFFSSRDPSAIYTYASRFIGNSQMIAPIRQFIEAVCDDRLTTTRYIDSEHLSRIDHSIIDRWKRNKEVILPNEDPKKILSVTFSDDWQDLFLSGTEIFGSCQRVDGDPEFTKCLMSYVLDGKNKILTVINADGKKVARSILKLLIDKDDRPCVFMEAIYPDDTHRVTLEEEALKIARSLGLELYKEGGIHQIESFASKAPFEYEDAGIGISEGIYTIYGQKIDG